MIHYPCLERHESASNRHRPETGANLLGVTQRALTGGQARHASCSSGKAMVKAQAVVFKALQIAQYNSKLDVGSVGSRR